MPDTPEVVIAGISIGSAHPPVIWPDIDVYFRRDEAEAKSLIDALAAAGGSFLKGAVLHRADLALPGYPVTYFDHVAGEQRTRDYRAIMEEMVVPLPQLARILDHGRRAGLRLVLSIYDHEGMAFAVAEGAEALKIPSSNITHKHLIETAARTGLPIVIDTGRSRWAEIDRAVRWAKSSGAEGRLLLQHSPPGPPSPAGTFHMRMIEGLASAYAVPVGLSDHHPGLDMVPIAIALGASVIEKGLVASAAGAGIDRAHALAASDLLKAIRLIQESFQSLGEYRRPDKDAPPSLPDRMGCIAARPLRRGQLITREDISFAFPVVGVGAECVDQLIERRLTCDLPAGGCILPSLLDSE
jgi:sialic acid synthase SpsE